MNQRTATVTVNVLSAVVGRVPDRVLNRVGEATVWLLLAVYEHRRRGDASQAQGCRDTRGSEAVPCNGPAAPPCATLHRREP